MKRIGLPVILLALIGAFVFWWFSPIQVLKRRSTSLLETLTLQENSSKPSRQMGVYSLNAMLASEVELSSTSIREANGTFERSELESAFSWLCEQAKETRFEMQKIRSVKIDGDQATVELSLNAVVVLPTYRPADGSYDATFTWQNEDNKWRLAKAVWSEAKK